METNESVQAALWHHAEMEVQKVMERVQGLADGDLKGLEEQVMATVFALGRAWMESLLSSRQHSERPAARRLGACGHEQRLVGERPKQVLTLLGKVTMRRAYYQCLIEEAEETSCTHGEAPADALWGIHERRTTAGVQQAMGSLCASLTLQEAAETFSRLLPLEMSARQALTLMQPVGETLARQEDTQVKEIWQQAGQARSDLRAEAEPEGMQQALERLYVELDGVTARLRRGSVLMEDKEVKRRGDVYREVKVGAVFQPTRGPERSGLAPGVFVDQAGEKQYVARRTTAEHFGKVLYAQALRCGLSHAQQVVILGDGALWIWRLASEHFPHAVQIVDVWHAREHVWKVARAVFGAGTPQAATWAEHACSLLVQGKIEDLVTEMVTLPPVPPEPGASRSVPEIERDYFISNAPRMRYPAFRAQGMHVGSGIAEAACKTVVSTRAKRSGMRWTPAGLDAVLALRVAVLNRTYDQFCKQQPRLLA
jgi:hypothetical protein